MIDLSTLNDDELQALYAETKADRDRFDTKQLSAKILINSAYGAVGNGHFKYHDGENVESITKTGQAITQSLERAVNEYLNSVIGTTGKDYVIAADTDSLYLHLAPLIEKIDPNLSQDKRIDLIDKISDQKIAQVIQKELNSIYEYMNHKENLLSMSRENIASAAVWTAKKRYFMDVYDKEGIRFDIPKMKVMGLEVVRSSTPNICRKKLQQALEIILRKDESDLIAFIKEFKKEFYSSPVESVAFPRSVSELHKWVTNQNKIKSGCPIHVRAALAYNRMLKQTGIDKKHDTIKEGEKIKFVYLRKPNHIFEHVIGFKDKVPKEFGVERYVDYETQFDKTFLSPLTTICDLIGWNTEEKNDFSAFC